MLQNIKNPPRSPKHTSRSIENVPMSIGAVAVLSANQIAPNLRENRKIVKITVWNVAIAQKAFGRGPY